MPFYLYLLSKFAAMYGTSIVSIIVVFVYLQQLSFRTCYGKNNVPKKRGKTKQKKGYKIVGKYWICNIFDPRSSQCGSQDRHNSTVASELCQRFLFTNIRIADVEELQQLDEVE